MSSDSNPPDAGGRASPFLLLDREARIRVWNRAAEAYCPSLQASGGRGGNRTSPALYLDFEDDACFHAPARNVQARVCSDEAVLGRCTLDLDRLAGDDPAFPGWTVATLHADAVDTPAGLRLTDDRPQPVPSGWHQRIVEALPEIFFVLSASGRLLLWNRNLEQVSGYTADELDHCDALRLWATEDHAAVRERTRQTHRDGTGTIEARLQTRDGRTIDYLLTGVRSEIDGESVIISFGSDVTERRRAETERARLAEVFRQMRDAVVILDGDFNVLNFNAAYQALTGRRETHHHGPIERVFSIAESGDEDGDAAIWRAVATHGMWEGEVDVVTQAGEKVGHWLTAVAVGEGASRAYILYFQDISQWRETRRLLHHHAYYDPMTGVGNRLRLHEVATQAMHRAARADRSMALIAVDLQRFRDINNTLGTETGDALLGEIAGRIQSTVRGADSVARIGGNEFAVCLEQIDSAQQAYAHATRLCERILEPVRLAGQTIEPTVAMGIALYSGESLEVDDLLRQANTAMHEAKAWGANAIFFYSEELTRRAIERAELARNLREGLEHHWFLLHYQKQVDLLTGSITGVECLLRFEHPDRGPVSPGVFIPVAESSGLIDELGRWALREACAQGRRWLDAGNDFGRIAVNVSALQLESGGFPDLVRETLQESGLPPDRLELEITESALVHGDATTTIDALTQLRRLGVRIMIDDFGTGYSSLIYLRRLPADGLKVDKQFVDELLESVDAQKLVDTIITLARHLDLEIVVEGVETEAQRAFLSRYPDLIGQGFLWSRPQSGELCTRVLQEGRA